MTLQVIVGDEMRSGEDLHKVAVLLPNGYEKFGQTYASGLHRRRPRPGDRRVGSWRDDNHWR
jgi:hypothetical protein